MATAIVMPKFGQMTEESTIVEWLKKEGEHVAKGEVLFTVETDKSVMEVESFAEGTLLKIAVPPGVSVAVQSVVGYLGAPGEAIPALTPAAPAPAPVAPTAPAVPAAPTTPASAAVAAPAPAAPLPPASALAGAPPALRISPRARALVRASVIDAAPIQGSGPAGRIVEKDVAAYLKAKGYERLRVSPAAKRLAAQEKIDLLAVQGGGGNGRIELADIERAMAEKPKPMSKMRQIIAQRLSHSMASAPHFYVTVEADVSDLLAGRARLKESGAVYSLTDFIALAAVQTLRQFPVLNSSTDGVSVRWSSHVHLGLAVALEEGLVVPVIRNADELSLAELSARAKELFAQARAGKLAPDQMTGSTFTISNMGMLDVENFTAIINPGEAAILAVASARPKPAILNGQLAVRSLMKMTLSSDHRIVDGATAANFLNALKQNIHNINTQSPT